MNGVQIASVTSETAEVTVNAITTVSSDINITIRDMVEWILLPTPTQTVTAGVDATFTITGTYTSYQWYLDGETVGTNSATYTFNRQPGVYEIVVVVQNSAGEQRSGRVRVSVVRP
jgi:hypothetical protein